MYYKIKNIKFIDFLYKVIKRQKKIKIKKCYTNNNLKNGKKNLNQI